MVWLVLGPPWGPTPKGAGVEDVTAGCKSEFTAVMSLHLRSELWSSGGEKGKCHSVTEK